MSKQRAKAFLVGMAMFLFATTLFAQGPDTLWTKTYGGNGVDYGYSVCQTSDGGYIAAGCTFSFEHQQPYLVKTDENGDKGWEIAISSGYGSCAYSVCETSDQGYITAGFDGTGYYNILLVKTDAWGAILWQRTYGGDSIDIGFCIRQTTDGGFIVSGLTSSFGAGGYDVYLMKTNPVGDTLWTRTYGGAGDEGGASVHQTADGGYVICGATNSFGAGGDDVYLIRTDANGDTLWTRTYGGPGDERGHSVDLTSDGGYIVAGYTYSFGAGGKDVYLVKTDADGDSMWAKAYGGEAQDEARSVQEVSDSGYVVAGFTSSFGVGGDVYLIKTDADGDTMWTCTYGGPGDDGAGCVCQTSDKGYIISGGFDPPGEEDHSDLYLIKTERDPAIDAIEEENSPQGTLVLSEPEPNPFADRTLIKYSLPRSDRVRLAIYDPLGRKIRTLVDGRQDAGTYTTYWDASDNSNRQVSAGLYFILLETRGFRETGKLVLVR